MNDRRFSQPVTILVGLGYPYQVESVLEAYSILTDWPGGQNPAQAAALNACRAAIIGDLEADTVRSAFEAFARRTGILMPEIALSSEAQPGQPQILQ